MKTVLAYFNSTLLARVSKPTWEEAEHIAQQYDSVFGGGEGFKLVREDEEETKAILAFEM